MKTQTIPEKITIEKQEDDTYAISIDTRHAYLSIILTKDEVKEFIKEAIKIT